MSDTPATLPTEFVLPASVVSKADITRLVLEMEQVDNELTTAAVRARTGAVVSSDIALSQQLTDFLVQNQLTLDNGNFRGELVKHLRVLKDSVPIIHMTFAVTADHESLKQLAAWVRSTLHPQAVIDVKLQPALLGGAHVRTANRIFDLSLRSLLAGHRNLIVKDLEVLSGRR